MTDWTDERKAAAVELARLRRPHAHPDSVVAKLCDIIDPPAPAIAPCPYCGAECSTATDMVDVWHSYCTRSLRECAYHGPVRHTEREAIAAHNDICERLKRTETKPRTCGGCKHFDPDPGLLCRTAHYTGGQARVLDRPAIPTRDASECERWEQREEKKP